MKPAILLFLVCGVALAAGRFTLREITPRSLELLEDGKPVLVYNHGIMMAPGAPEDRRRAGYIHPLYAPNGAVVTDDFPKDHYHHRGLSWMWQRVRVDGKWHDLWMHPTGVQRFVRWRDRKAGQGRAVIAAENEWVIEGRRVMKEEVEIEARPAEGSSRNLDFTLRFTAVEKPVTLQGEIDNHKGYGGFNIRFAPREDTLIRSADSDHEQDSDMKPLPWAELLGTYQGRRAATRITQDAENQGFPNGWCLRNYGFLGVNYPGLQELILEPGKPVTLKYRVTISSVAP